MMRQLWVLLGWSSDHGAAVVPVAVLGVEDGSSFVEWVPREYESSRIWRERIATVAAGELLERMGFWENTPVAPAARVESLLPSAGLADDVRAQVDDIVGSAH